MSDIVRIVICIEDAAGALFSDIRKVIVENQKQYWAKETALRNSLITYPLGVTEL